MKSIAIIGAGLSGISCARRLADAGVNVTIFEKSRSLGGRCASRRWEGNVVDHGAQYFTIRDGKFQLELEKCCGNSLRRITAPVIDANRDAGDEGTERWYHREGNNRIAKNLLGNFPIHMEFPVSALVREGTTWAVGKHHFDAVVSSAPLPQSLALLGHHAAAPTYTACLTAFFSYRGDWVGNTADCYGRRDVTSPLEWSACENHKAGRVTAGQTVIVAQASPAFSAEHLEDDPTEWIKSLQERVEAEWNLPRSGRISTFTHRWRYARFVGPATLPPLPEGFFLTGDSQATSRLESAWLAGQKTGEEILET